MNKDEYSTDESVGKRKNTEDIESFFTKSKRTQRTPTKVQKPEEGKIEEGKIDLILRMITDMKTDQKEMRKEVHQIREEQRAIHEELKKVREENQSIKNENVQIKKENEGREEQRKTIIAVYGPNEDDKAENKDKFWEELTIAVEEAKDEYLENIKLLIRGIALGIDPKPHQCLITPGVKPPNCRYLSNQQQAIR
ncbi:hypothetical protein QE152_g9851 [Popillia japonica]|uniref:Uncharacterized protein n=1 Tax=Popillia japonica TaxID=7064 RepID=A0AAW1LVR3_POPJA